MILKRESRTCLQNMTTPDSCKGVPNDSLWGVIQGGPVLTIQCRVQYFWLWCQSQPSFLLSLSQSSKICKNSRCRYCPLPNTTGRVTSTSIGRSYTCLKNITCKSDNLVYLITCKQCGLQYVGQTYRSIAQRFLGHFNDISNERHWKAVGEHYNKQNHHGWSDCEISVLYTLRNYFYIDMGPLHPMSFWRLLARLDMDIYPQNRCDGFPVWFKLPSPVWTNSISQTDWQTQLEFSLYLALTILNNEVISE